jgi:hypothetical protein
MADRQELASHILPVSGTMIGICITLIGLIKVAENHIGPTRVDEYAAIAAMVFLGSGLTSYLAMRFAHRRSFSTRLERAADIVFLVGLVGITVVAALFAYEVI